MEWACGRCGEALELSRKKKVKAWCLKCIQESQREVSSRWKELQARERAVEGAQEHSLYCPDAWGEKMLADALFTDLTISVRTAAGPCEEGDGRSTEETERETVHGEGSSIGESIGEEGQGGDMRERGGPGTRSTEGPGRSKDVAERCGGGCVGSGGSCRGAEGGSSEESAGNEGHSRWGLAEDPSQSSADGRAQGRGRGPHSTWRVLRSFQVHRAVLASRSLVFERMLTGGLRESQERLVYIDDMTPPAVYHTLFYIYTGKLPDTFSCEETGLELLMTADKYDLPHLRSILGPVLVQATLDASLLVHDVKTLLGDAEFDSQLCRTLAANRIPFILQRGGPGSCVPGISK